MAWLLNRLHAILIGTLSLIVIALAGPAMPDVPLRVADWEKAWTDVLTRSVDISGRIDFASLARDRAGLDLVVAFIALNDPSSRPDMFPDRNARLAYYINAYNALAMFGVVDEGVPRSLGGLKKVMFFYFRKFDVGVSRISLYDLENKVIRPIGEERIHFLLNCMVASCPRLPRVAVSPGDLEGQLEAAARSFVDDRRNVQVDRDRREVRLSAIFKFYTEDFTTRAPNLIAYVNRYRTDPIPLDFKIRFLDYDWTVNARNGTMER